MEKWSRDELDYIVKRTLDPSTLPPGMLDQMKAAKVGPFAHSEAEWQAAFGKIFGREAVDRSLTKWPR
jgi:hypothetical protein